VAVAEAHVGAIASYYTATATLAAEKEAQILAQVSGVVEKLRCEEGDRVAVGQILLSIDNDEYRYRLAQAEANSADLRSRFQRLEEMRRRDLVPAEQFETLKNELKAAEAEEGLARLTLSYTDVKAPFRGAVVSRLVDVGQNVNVGTPLFLFSDFDPLLARVHVPSKEFKKLKPDQEVELVLESNQERLRGRIKLVSPVIDPSSGTIKVTIEVPEYPDGVRPGDFAEVRIVTERRTESTLVPKIAMVTDRGETVVYIAADSTAERRVVEVGFEDENNLEIISGVSSGEPVVVKGQRSLKHGSPIKILPDALETSAADTSRTAQEDL
jgi:membrane fusion protein (multidrug efflux system)